MKMEAGYLANVSEAAQDTMRPPPVPTTLEWMVGREH